MSPAVPAALAVSTAFAALLAGATAIEVEACREVNGETEWRVPEQDATFFGVYARQAAPDGRALWLADYRTRDAAEFAAAAFRLAITPSGS